LKIALQEKDSEILPEESTEKIAKVSGENLFQTLRDVLNTSTNKKNNLQANYLTADILKNSDTVETFTHNSASENKFKIFSATNTAIIGGLLAITITTFIMWLIRNERKLILATSRRFQELEHKPNFDLKKRAKKRSVNKRLKTKTRN
jgi:hypothetical protein